jgi:hypothetical protein
LLLGPGWCDLEQFEDAALGVGEAVEFDAVLGVGADERISAVWQDFRGWWPIARA